MRRPSQITKAGVASRLAPIDAAVLWTPRSVRETLRTTRCPTPKQRARICPPEGHGSEECCPELWNLKPPQMRRCRKSLCPYKFPLQTGPGRHRTLRKHKDPSRLDQRRFFERESHHDWPG